MTAVGGRWKEMREAGQLQTGEKHKTDNVGGVLKDLCPTWGDRNTKFISILGIENLRWGACPGPWLRSFYLFRLCKGLAFPILFSPYVFFGEGHDYSSSLV